MDVIERKREELHKWSSSKTWYAACEDGHAFWLGPDRDSEAKAIKDAGNHDKSAHADGKRHAAVLANLLTGDQAPAQESFGLSSKLLVVQTTSLQLNNALGVVTKSSAVDHVTGDPTEYAYDDKTSLALGRGFNPSDVSAKPKAPCILWTPEPLNPGPSRTDFTLMYVTSHEELSFVLGIDMKVEASYLAASGDAHTRLDASFLRKQNCMTVVMTARTAFGRWGLKAGASLTDQAKGWLKDPAMFAERCGSRYVSIEGRGASVSAVITLNSVSQDTKIAFESEMSGGGGWGPVSGKAAAMFRFEGKSAASQDRLDVQIFATGGGGLGALADTVKSQMKLNTGIEQALSSLSTFIGQFNKDNAATTYYRVSSMEDFGWDPTGIESWTDSKEKRLRETAKYYRLAADDLNIAQRVLKGTHPLALVLDKDDIDRIGKDLPKVEQYLARVAKRHSTCKLNQSSSESYCDVYPYSESLRDDLKLYMLDEPRIRVNIYGLTEAQARVVLGAPPHVRFSYARQYNPKIEVIYATLNTPGWHQLSLGVSFLDDHGTEEGIYREGPWSSYGLATWYLDRPVHGYDPWEDWFKTWMVSRAGRHSGTVFMTLKDKMHRTFRMAFMNVSWESNGHTFSSYNYEFVY